jgi:hypothetical protein
VTSHNVIQFQPRAAARKSGASDAIYLKDTRLDCSSVLGFVLVSSLPSSTTYTREISTLQSLGFLNHRCGFDSRRERFTSEDGGANNENQNKVRTDARVRAP